MFDPYRKWLGIPPKDQPPNHYRLLGVEVFESDPDVIEGAADRQMNFVRQYQSGEQATDAAKLLNELAIARLCLLKPATKKAYDSKLQAELAVASTIEDQFSDLAFDEMEAAPKRETKRSRRKQAAKGTPPLLIGGGILVLILVLAFVLFPRGRRHEPVEQASTDVAVTPTPSVATPNPVPPVAVEPKSTQSMLWTEPKLIVERAGSPVDLMKTVDLARDVGRGEWKQTSTALISAPNSRLYFPQKLPEDYQFNLTARRIEGAQGLVMGFMMAGRQGMAIVDAWTSTVNGIYVDGREVNDNATTFHSKPLSDQTIQIAITVHPGHFHMAVDGKTITNWHGKPEQLSNLFGMGSRESLFLDSIESAYVIESATMVPIKPEAPHKRPERLTESVDVQSLIDLDRDTQRGIWGEAKGRISSPDGLGQILLPVIVPEEYTLSAKIVRLERAAGEPVIMFGLIAGESPFRICLKNDEAMSIDMIDGRRWNENGTWLQVPFCKLNAPAQIDCTVTKQGIRMEVDGKTLIDWEGDFKRLSMVDEWATRDARKLFIATMSHFQFSDIKLGPPKPPKKLPAHDKITTDKSLDLLALIDPVRDATQGTWKFESGVLRTLADSEYSKLDVPAEVPEEYLLTMRVAREPGGPHVNEALCIGLPFGTYRGSLVVDGGGSSASGFYLGRSEYNDNPTTYRGTVIPTDEAVELEILVRKAGVKITSAGRSLIDWTGNPANFSQHPRQGGPGRGIMLASWKQRFRFEKLTIRAVPPSEVAAVPELTGDGNLLPILDLARDVREGTWNLGPNGLETPPNYYVARMKIPCTVPDNYALELTAERLNGTDDFLIGLPMNGHPCLIAMDGDAGKQTGLEQLDNHWIYDPANFTGRRTGVPLFPQGQRVDVTCYVLPDCVVMNCGGLEIIRWHGDPRRLSLAGRYLPVNYSEDDRQHLWLGSWLSGFRITKLNLRRLTTGEVKELSASFDGVTPSTPQLKVPLKAGMKLAE